MPRNTISADPSRKRRLRFRVGRDGVIHVDFGTKDISQYVFDVQFRKRAEDDDSAFELTESNGGVVHTSATTIDFVFTQASSAVKAMEYFYTFNRLAPDGTYKAWLNGPGEATNDEIDNDIEEDTITVDDAGTTIEITVSEFLSSVVLIQEAYSTVLTFDKDKEIFKDATGLSPIFTLGAPSYNGVGIILRLNKPTAVTFPANFEANPNSSAVDATKMNVFMLVYFADWDVVGTPRIIYNNSLYTAV